MLPGSLLTDALVAVVVAMVLIPGAVLGIQAAPTDTGAEFEELDQSKSPAIELEPAEGVDQYVEVREQPDGSSELSIDIGESDEPGVNINATTEFDTLFTVTNTDVANATARLYYNRSTSQLTFTDSSGEPIPANVSSSDQNTLDLNPGEQERIGLALDTDGFDAGEQLTATITIFPGDGDGDSGDGSDSGGDDDGGGDSGDSDGGDDGGGDGDGDGGDGGGDSGDSDGGNDDDGGGDSGDSDGDGEQEVIVDDEAADDEGAEDDTDGGSTEDTVDAEVTELSPEEIEDSGETIADAQGATAQTGDGGQSASGSGSESDSDSTDGGDSGSDSNSDTTATAGGISVAETVDQTTAADSSEEIATAAVDGFETGDAALAGSDTDAAAIRDIGLDRSALENLPSDLAQQIDDDAIFTITGLRTTVDGSGSTIAPAAAVSQREPLATYDIEPQESVEGTPTVTIPVDAAELEGADPDDLVIGRLTDTGWQLLDTTAAREDGTVSVTAETPGFSVFAVFASADVSYEWTFPDGTTRSGVSVDHSFAEPGTYDVELTVTNALGRSSTSTVQYVVDDLPTVEPEIADEGDDNRTTLAATVNNELGETTVTWLLPDGTELTGTEVAAALPPGENSVTIRVKDSFGLVAESEVVVSVDEAETVLEQVSQEPLVPLTALSSLVLFGTIRGYRRGSLQPVITRLRRGPEVRSLGGPVVDTEHSRVGVEELSVRDSYQLTMIDLQLQTASGGVVVHKEITIDTQASHIVSTYNGSPEWITLPPRLDLDPDTEYVFEVLVEDDAGYSTTERTRAFVLTDPGPDDASTSADGLL